LFLIGAGMQIKYRGLFFFYGGHTVVILMSCKINKLFIAAFKHNNICSFCFPYFSGYMLLFFQCSSRRHTEMYLNPLNPELNPICHLLALLAHHFLHVSRIMVKSLTLRLLMSYIERIFLMFLDHTQ